MPLRSRSAPRSPGTITVCVCWLSACEDSVEAPPPCSQKARQTISRKATRKPAKRSPMRRSIRRIAPLFRHGFFGDTGFGAFGGEEFFVFPVVDRFFFGRESTFARRPRGSFFAAGRSFAGPAFFAGGFFSGGFRGAGGDRPGGGEARGGLGGVAPRGVDQLR